MISILIIATKKNMDISAAFTALGSAGSLVTALAIIPKIIAEHLFPADEDKDMISLVKNMQLNDSEIRKRLK